MNWPFPPSALTELIGEPFASSRDLGAWAGRATATGELRRPSVPNEYLKRAIRLLGSQKSLAEKIGVKRNSISHWLRRKSVPADCVLAIEAATDFKVTCHDLRPDRHHECRHNQHAQPLPDCGVLRGIHSAPFYLSLTA